MPNQSLEIRDKLPFKSLSRLRDMQRTKPALLICKLIVGYPKTALGMSRGFVI